MAPKKGFIPWNKGMRGVQICSEETKKKMSETHKGEKKSKEAIKKRTGNKHFAWKGNSAGYDVSREEKLPVGWEETDNMKVLDDTEYQIDKTYKKLLNN